MSSGELSHHWYHAVPDAVIIIDPAAGLVVDVNQAACDLFHRPHADLIGQDHCQLYAPAHREHITNIYDQHLQDPSNKRPSKRFASAIVHADNTEVPIHAYSIRLPLDGRHFIAHTLSKISTNTQAEDLFTAMKHRIQRHQRALVSMAQAIGNPDLLFAGGCQIITKTLADTLGCARVSVWMLTDNDSTLECIDLYCQDEKDHSAGLRLESSRYPNYFNELYNARGIDAHHAQSDPRTVEFSDHYLIPLGITSMLDATIRMDGKVAGVVCCEHIGNPRTWTTDELAFAGQAADLATQMRLAELHHQAAEALAHSQRMDALGQLAGGIAHDFNNMLAGILGMSELLTSLPEANHPKINNGLGTIQRAANRAADLTSKLLAFSRKHHGSRKPCDIHAIIEDTLAIFERGSTQRPHLNVKLDAPAPVAMAEPASLQHAFLNLLINARDAIEDMTDKGQITIYTQAISEPVPQASEVEVVISDNGCGIAPQNIERIFEPFFTTKPIGKGTGLGLAAVYGIITGHEGTIAVESDVGKGTTFRMRIPLSDSKSLDPAAPPSPTPSHDLGITLLLIEDEAIVRECAIAILERLGYQCLEAPNAQSGIDTYQRQQQEIDLILLDMTMPGIDGEECFYQLRAIDPNVPIIIVSGHSPTGAIQRLMAAGAMGYVEKPFSMNDLAHAVREAHASSHTETRPAE